MNGSSALPHPSRVPIVALLMLLVAAPATIGAANPDDDQPAFALYASVDQGREYRPIDPLTLEDLTSARPLILRGEWAHMAASGDGSTVVVIDPSRGPLEDWISVRDGVDGPERLTIAAEEAVFNPRLSDDGSRLVVEPQRVCGPSDCGERVWYTYDTDTGGLISTTRTDAGDPIGPDLIDPASQHLYQPFYEGPPPPTHLATPTPPSSSDVGPWPLQIAAYDLTTGQEVGRIAVPNVFAGSWQGASVDGMYVGEIVQPAIALSPDGATIAVVDAGMETLTLIDAVTLEILETRDIHDPESRMRRMAIWLGIMPLTAQAKVSNGRMLSTTFSADGQHLYLSGNETEVGETSEDITGHGFGVMRIDLSNGEITGEALSGGELLDIVPSPDGHAVYVVVPESPWWDSDGQQSPGYAVYRLDAETLEPLAKRAVANWPNIMLIPIDDHE